MQTLNGRTLVVAEKSKVAKVFAGAIRKKEPVKWVNNHYESAHFIIEAVEGHIFQLFDIFDYTGKKEWVLEDLPFFPENYNFRFKLKGPGKNARQKPAEIFQRIQTALKKCNQVINLGDADNEGQILVDIVLFHAGNRLPTYRIWTNANTEEAMMKGLQNLEPNERYQPFALEGYIRMYSDWLYGINGSRFVTLKIGNGNVLGVGRVNTAITAAIYERDMEIKNFIPVPYFQAANKENIPLVHSKRFETEADCIKLCNQLNSHRAVVTSRVTKEKEVSAQKLFSLDKIQSFMARNFKINPEQTLKAMQKIYLDGYISYPRTDSEYLSKKEKDEIQNTIQMLNRVGFQLKLKSKKTIFDDQKVISHSALRPLKYPLPKENYSETEQKVYNAILNRFLAVFCSEPCLVDRSVMKIECGEEQFEIKGDIQKRLGWKKYEKVYTKDKSLPDYHEGDTFKVIFLPVEKKTTPPKHYTTETLMNFLNNPFAKDKHEDDNEEYENIRQGAVIGTPATRSGIIDNIIKYGYVTNDNDIYKITERGILVIEGMKKLGIEMTKEKTVEFGVMQKKVGSGEVSMIQALDQVKKEVILMCSNKDMVVPLLPSNDVGKCPKCGGPVKETQKAFCCQNKDFIISKKNKFFTSRGKRVTRKVVEELLSKGETRLKGCKKTDKKGTYSIYIAFDRNPDGSIKMYQDIFPLFKSHF